MNRDGANRIMSALLGNGLEEVRIAGRVTEEDDFRYLTIRDDSKFGVLPADILNALDETGLMVHSEDEFNPDKNIPQLKYLGSVGVAHTFEDLSAK